MQKNIENYREFRVLSMMRSGHHAIIDWMMKQQGGTSLFVNNIFEKSKDEFKKFSIYNEDEEDVVWNGGI